MTKQTTRYQGGSIVSFIVVAILIAVVLGGGLYVLRQRNEQARNQSSAPISAPTESTVSKEGASSTPAPGQPGHSSSTNEKDATPKNTTTENATSGATANQTGVLPTTGPEDVLIIPIVAVIVYAAVAYAGSKRQLLRIQS